MHCRGLVENISPDFLNFLCHSKDLDKQHASKSVKKFYVLFDKQEK